MMKVCEQCGKEHDGNFGSGRFCCRSCSNKWVAINQSAEAKARKIEKGKKNLIPHPEYLNKGYNFTEEDRKKSASCRKKPIEVYLVKNSSCSRTHLKNRLYQEGYKEWKCERCGITDWLGENISLQLHHKDGDSTNNELINLEFLCPNCHSQTENYGFKGARLKHRDVVK